MTERTDWGMILPIFFIIKPESDFFTIVIILAPQIRLLKTSLLSPFRHQIVHSIEKHLTPIYQINQTNLYITNYIIRFLRESIRLANSIEIS